MLDLYSDCFFKLTNFSRRPVDSQSTTSSPPKSSAATGRPFQQLSFETLQNAQILDTVHYEDEVYPTCSECVALDWNKMKGAWTQVYTYAYKHNYNPKYNYKCGLKNLNRRIAIKIFLN